MKKSELENILKDVELELADFMKSQTNELRKAADESGEGEDSAGEAGPGPDASATAPAPAGPEDASAGAPEGEGSPEAPGAEGAPAPEGAPADPAAQGAEGEQVDPAQLEAEYSQMPPEMLKAHFLACKSAVEKLMGAGAGPEAGGAPPPGPEAGPGAGAPPAPPAGPPPAMKAEKPMAQPSGSVKGTGTIKANGENDMGKSENFKTLEAQIEALTKAVSLIVERPIRKAMTGADFTSQPEQKLMTKSEITAKLAEKTADPKLSKNDRSLVNDFYDGRVGFDKIAHLLK